MDTALLRTPSGQAVPSAALQPAQPGGAAHPTAEKDVELGTAGTPGHEGGGSAAPPPAGKPMARRWGSRALPSHPSQVSSCADEGGVERRTWRGLWFALPTSAQALLAVSVVDSALLLAYAPFKTAKRGEHANEELHIGVALMVTAVFFLALVVGGLIQENGLQLLAALGLSLVVEARLLWFALVSKSQNESSGTRAALAVATCLLQAATVALAWLAWRQFGWRMNGRLAADHRKKDVRARVRRYFASHALRALLKLDLQFLVILGVVGILYASLRRGAGHSEPLVASLLAVNIAGVVTAALAGAAAWRGARRGASKFKQRIFRDCLLLDLLLPATLWWPIANLALAWLYADRANARASLVIASVAFILLRSAVLAAVHVAHHYDKQVDSQLDTIGGGDDLAGLHPDLVPLVRGSWLGKPSARSPRKRRYFQVSQDGLTLRWSWNRYTRLLHTQALRCDHAARAITIVTTADRDLTLKFPSQAKYQTWCDGLEQLLVALLAPGAPAAAAAAPGANALVLPATTRLQANPHLVGGAPHGDPTIDRHEELERLGFRVEATSGGTVITCPPGAPGGGGAERVHPFDDATQRARRTELARELSGLGWQFRAVLAPHAAPHAAPQPSSGVALAGPRGQRRPPKRNALTDVNARSRELQLLPPPAGQHDGPLSPPARGVAQAAQPHITAAPAVPLAAMLPARLEIYEFSELVLMEPPLGRGAQGVVYKGWLGAARVAVKHNYDFKESLREASMHASVGPHPNIVQLRGLCYHEGALYLVMEYCVKGSLQGLLAGADKKGWDTAKLVPILLGIARGMEHLHAHQPAVLHRDLKPGNVFVGFDQAMKIGDFGQARLVQLQDAAAGSQQQLTRVLTAGVRGTVQYAAPELYNEEAFEGLPPDPRRLLKIDVYAFGVTLWQCMARRTPHADKRSHVMMGLLSVQPHAMALPPLKAPSSLPQHGAQAWASLARLAEACTAVRPDERPAFPQIVAQLGVLQARAAAPARRDLAPVKRMGTASA